MTEADVIALLQNPEKLLRKCYLAIAGAATPTPPANGQADPATFSVSINPLDLPVEGFTTGLSAMRGVKKDRVKVRITRLKGPAKPVPAANEFNAYYIPMVQTAD